MEGRFDEALTTAKRAVDLAPADFYPAYILGVAHLSAHHLDKAIEQFRTATEMNPASPRGHDLLAHAYALAGQSERAVEESDLAVALSRRATVFLLHKAVVSAIMRKPRGALRVLETAKKNWKPDGTSSFDIAAVHGWLGEKDAAFEWLEKAFQEHAPLLVYLKANWLFENLRGDPRLDKLVKRVGIPD